MSIALRNNVSQETQDKVPEDSHQLPGSCAQPKQSAETGLAVADGGKPERRRDDEYADVIAMVAELRALPEDSGEYAQQRDRIVLRCCPLADHVARHFDKRGENLEDLVQVARVGLIQAVNRFDPDRGSSFVAFALPTMMGELRRYFRDFGWKVHVPRRIRDRQHEINCTTADLTHELGRPPGIDELAKAMDLDRGQVVESLLAARAYQPESLDAAVTDQESSSQSIGDTYGDVDEGFQWVTDRESVKPLLAALPAREQNVLYLRYFASKTQRQIAERIGVSQMHVSRILDRTLRDLRRQVGVAG